MSQPISKPDPLRLSREELYAAVWETPARQLAARFGISDVGLAKVCKRMGIPRPPRGYWRKKETGHRVRRVTLPKAKPGYQQEVVFLGEFGTVPRRRKGVRILPEVFLSFRQPHPEVDAAGRALRTASANAEGLLVLPTTSPLELHVSRGRLPDALRIADALLKAWMEEGHKIRPKSEANPFLSLIAGSVEIHLAISEEKDGRLCVELTGEPSSRLRSYRRLLREKRNLSLEAWIGRVFAIMLQYRDRRREYLLDLERRAEELELWRQDCERRAREQAAIVRKWEEERRRTNALIKGQSEWRRAREFQEFLSACCDRMIENGEAPEEICRWVAWAESKMGRSHWSPETWVEQTIFETRERGEEERGGEGRERGRTIFSEERWPS